MLLLNKSHNLEYHKLPKMKKVLLFVFSFCSILAQAQSFRSLPGKIEAENYAAMSGIGTETTADEGGGLDIGWIGDNSWMDYNVNVAAAGYYTFVFRISNGFSPDAAISLQ